MNWRDKHILIIRLSSLGDILLTTPIIRAFAKTFNARIDFVVKKNFVDALKYNPYISELFVYKDDEEFLQKLTREKYYAVIDLQNNFRSRKITKRLKAQTFRFIKPTVRKFLLVKFKINYLKPEISIVNRYADSLTGVRLDENGLDLFLPDNIKPDLSDNKNYIGICPGAQHFTKRYPVDYQIQLAKLLLDNGYQPVLFGGKADKEICKQINNKVQGVIDLSTEDDLMQIAANMKKCNAVICNDSGLMHTAAAIKAPVVAIFGSTVREFGFAPYGVKNIIIENNALNCRPCSHIGKNKCPKKHFRCMLDITPEKVLAYLQKFTENSL